MFKKKKLGIFLVSAFGFLSMVNDTVFAVESKDVEQVIDGRKFKFTGYLSRDYPKVDDSQSKFRKIEGGDFLQIGEKIGCGKRYEILGPEGYSFAWIGNGSFGRAYLALDKVKHSFVVLKIDNNGVDNLDYSNEMTKEVDFQRAFIQGQKPSLGSHLLDGRSSEFWDDPQKKAAWDKLSSHITCVQDLFKVEKRACLVISPMLDETLDKRLTYKSIYKMSLAEIKQFCHDILETLEGLDMVGVVHGDVKSDNIGFLNNHGYLFDFGCAHLAGTDNRETRPFPMFGPEVCLGAKYGTRSDVWAFGEILRGMLLEKDINREMNELPRDFYEINEFNLKPSVNLKEMILNSCPGLAIEDEQVNSFKFFGCRSLVSKLYSLEGMFMCGTGTLSKEIYDSLPSFYNQFFTLQSGGDAKWRGFYENLRIYFEETTVQQIQSIVKSPFFELSSNSCLQKVRACDTCPSGENLVQVKKKWEELAHLASEMLQVDPKNRISPTDALKHPFFK